MHLIGKLEVFFIMQQTGAYFDAIYERIWNLSKISAMYEICILIISFIFGILIKHGVQENLKDEYVWWHAIVHVN